MTDEEPFTTESGLRELYHDRGLSFQEIADEFDTTYSRVRYYKRKFDIDGRPSGVSAEAYNLTDDELERMYAVEKRTMQEIADDHNCSRTYIRNRLVEADIERRDRGPRANPPSFGLNDDGYELIQASNGKGESPDAVRVHQLVAILDGAEPADVFDDAMHCHHKNRIPFDNRPENIEVISESEHHTRHVDEIPRDDHGNFTSPS